MGVVRIGQTEVAYELRRSAASSERRITVTPGHVEVLALTTDDQAEIDAFLVRKRKWLFNTLRELETKTSKRAVVPRFMTGSKIPYRGRRVRLTVRHHDGANVEIAYRNGFFVDLPSWVGDVERERVVANELKLWLKRRARADALIFANFYAKRCCVQPRSIRVAEMKNGWGSCGTGGNITLNWHLVFAPKRVFEYVAAHEIAHLRIRSHGPSFWKEIKRLMPAYEEAKAWLDANSTMLDITEVFPELPSRP